MPAVTLTNLRARARSRADMPTAGFIADDANGIDAWINEGIQKLYELLVKAYGESWAEDTYTLTTSSGVSDYAFSGSDVIAVYGVTAVIGGVYIPLERFEAREEANLRNQTRAGWYNPPKYRFISGALDPQAGTPQMKLRLLPAPDGAYSVTIRLAPGFVLLSNAAHTVNFPNGWERYVVVYTAIQMLRKEESDTSGLEAELAKMEQELEELAQRRIVDQPHSAIDADETDDITIWP